MAKLYESLSLIYNKNMITSIQEESNRPQKRTQNEYESMYAKLHSFIDVFPV